MEIVVVAVAVVAPNSIDHHPHIIIPIMMMNHDECSPLHGSNTNSSQQRSWQPRPTEPGIYRTLSLSLNRSRCSSDLQKGPLHSVSTVFAATTVGYQASNTNARSDERTNERICVMGVEGRHRVDLLLRGWEMNVALTAALTEGNVLAGPLLMLERERERRVSRNLAAPFVVKWTKAARNISIGLRNE